MPSRKKAWVHGGRACGQQPGLYMSHSHCKGRIAGGAASSHSSTVCPIHPSLAFCNKANMRISENMGKKISNLSLMGQAQCSSVATEFHFQHHFLNKKFADSSLSICCIWFGKHYLTSLFSVTWLEGKKIKRLQHPIKILVLYQAIQGKLYLRYHLQWQSSLTRKQDFETLKKGLGPANDCDFFCVHTVCVGQWGGFHTHTDFQGDALPALSWELKFLYSFFFFFLRV